MGEDGEGQFFKPPSPAWMMVGYFGFGLVLAAILYLAALEISFNAMLVFQLVYWAVWAFVARGILDLNRRLLVMRTELTVERSCHVAETYSGTTEVEVTKKHWGDVVHYVTYSFLHKVTIYIRVKRSPTELRTLIAPENRTEEILAWLDGLGSAIRDAEWEAS
jgi:hypothetical protein